MLKIVNEMSGHVFVF